MEAESQIPKGQCPNCRGIAGNLLCKQCNGSGFAPMLVITERRVMCNIHGEPFRNKWPSGYATFSVMLTKKVMESEVMTQEAGGDIIRLGACLDVKPACCSVTKAELLEVYKEVNKLTNGLLWPVAKCNKCGKNNMCSPFRHYNHWGRPSRRYMHLCFNCLVNMKTKD